MLGTSNLTLVKPDVSDSTPGLDLHDGVKMAELDKLDSLDAGELDKLDAEELDVGDRCGGANDCDGNCIGASAAVARMLTNSYTRRHELPANRPRPSLSPRGHSHPVFSSVCHGGLQGGKR